MRLVGPSDFGGFKIESSAESRHTTESVGANTPKEIAVLMFFKKRITTESTTVGIPDSDVTFQKAGQFVTLGFATAHCHKAVSAWHGTQWSAS
jgi:hypothetical protein